MAAKIRLGELLVQKNIVSQETINDALRVQVSGNKRLGNILIRMKAISADQLTDTLSQQLEIPLTDIESEFSPDVKKVLPRYLCKKYSVIPLRNKNNNILLTAMTDPSDDEAIKDIEYYTNNVVEPCLAKPSAINKAISQHIPLSHKDLFNQQANTILTRSIACIALVLVIFIGAAGYNYIHDARYGSISHLHNSTIYEHHDLLVGFDKSGKISLLGHSAFSEGYYSASFNNIASLMAFINSSQDDFSTKQKNWLNWVLTKEAPEHSLKTSLASNKN